MTTFDDILEEAGKFGRCQKRIFILLCMVSMPWAGVYVGIVFQGFTPDHWCRDPAVVERREACGWNLAESQAHSTSGQQLWSAEQLWAVRGGLECHWAHLWQTGAGGPQQNSHNQLQTWLGVRLRGKTVFCYWGGEQEVTANTHRPKNKT